MAEAWTVTCNAVWAPPDVSTLGTPQETSASRASRWLWTMSNALWNVKSRSCMACITCFEHRYRVCSRVLTYRLLTVGLVCAKTRELPSTQGEHDHGAWS